MIRLLLPLILAIVGTGAGVGAGLALRPPAAESGHAGAQAEPEEGNSHHDALADTSGASEKRRYVKLNNQFIVPVIAGEQVDALVILSLSLEIAEGQRETVYSREPKLRDALLQVMFDHANMGGFDGAFTRSGRLETLRTALTETARGVIGPNLRKVLIVDIARQDV